jgi:hypothetical protein
VIESALFLQIESSSSTIWEASSLVGARTSADGLRASVLTSSTSGMPKARVLPEPVGDCTRTSRPARTSSMTRLWTAKGVSIPRFSSADVVDLEMPRSAKDFLDIFTSRFFFEGFR